MNHQPSLGLLVERRTSTCLTHKHFRAVATNLVSGFYRFHQSCERKCRILACQSSVTAEAASLKAALKVSQLAWGNIKIGFSLGKTLQTPFEMLSGTFSLWIQQTDQVISFFKNTDACVYLHIEWKRDAITSGHGRRMLMQVWCDGREGELSTCDWGVRNGQICTMH